MIERVLEHQKVPDSPNLRMVGNPEVIGLSPLLTSA